MVGGGLLGSLSSYYPLLFRYPLSHSQYYPLSPVPNALRNTHSHSASFLPPLSHSRSLRYRPGLRAPLPVPRLSRSPRLRLSHDPCSQVLGSVASMAVAVMSSQSLARLRLHPSPELSCRSRSGETTARIRSAGRRTGCSGAHAESGHGRRHGAENAKSESPGSASAWCRGVETKSSKHSTRAQSRK